MAEFEIRRLLDTASVAVRDVRCRGECRHRSGEECVSATHVVFPYRGVYLQGNEAAAPIFRAWMEPFRNIGMTDLTIRNTGGTDHLSFHAVGLPGFQFVQDPVQYSSRTHHSNLDTYDQLIASDLMKNAAITAAFVYHTANREQMLPRRALPKAAGTGTR